MEFFEVVKQRHCIRAFDSKALEPVEVQEILKAASAAPSAGNLQAYEIYLVRKASLLAALAGAAGKQECVASAPLALVFCAHPARSAPRYGDRGKRLYALQDATIACTFAMLAATALGLGSVWVGAFEDAAVHRILKAKEDWRPVALLPIGYPAESPAPTPRRALGELVLEASKL